MADIPEKVKADFLAIVANDSRSWLDTALMLLRVAKGVKNTVIPALYPEKLLKILAEFGFAREFGAYLMLLGFAVECALKGIWLANGNTMVLDGKFQKIPSVGDHRLNQLATAADIGLNDYERRLLGGMTRAILYAGRYPIPKKASDWNLTTLDEPAESKHFEMKDFDAAEALVERIVGKLQVMCDKKSV